jgi:diguanylate cyclase (GGDEF)-like protein
VAAGLAASHRTHLQRDAMPQSPPSIPTVTPRGEDRVRPSSRGRLVSAATWLMLLVCVTGAAVAAVAQRSAVRTQDRRAFDAASRDATASMASAVRRDIDFVSTMAATLALQPRMTNAEWRRWIHSSRALDRFPGGIGYGFTAAVPAAELAAFGRRLAADPPRGASLPGGRFAVTPPGRRAGYCLVRLSVTPAVRVPLGFDLCAAPVAGLPSTRPGAFLRLARDSGQTTVVALNLRGGLFGTVTPVYRGGQTPATVGGRRAALLGWAAGSFDGSAILAAAGSRKTGLRVEISHRNAGQVPESVAALGTAKTGSRVRTRAVDADGAWTVSVAGELPRSGLSAATQFWVVLLVGLGLSGLLFGFVRVLARSRGRALWLVDRKTAELRHLALHDGLTGLPNRALILDRVEHALARARRQQTELALIFIDLDSFKNVNDTLGHAAGDALLCALGARLRGLLRDSDTVGRLGGDEFVVVIEGSSLDPGVQTVADRIREILAAPFTLGDTAQSSVQVRTSMGIAIGLRDTAEDLLHDADLALYEAKAAGRDRFVLFAPEMQAAIERRVELEHDLRAAVAGDELYLDYQPMFELATMRLTGVEALLRWRHPTRGRVMPDDFIPLTEATGLIVPIGRWVLDRACRQAAAWQTGPCPLTVSVNVSGRQLEPDADIVAHVQAALADSGLPPGSLTLEVTETVLMRDAEAGARHLRALKALGVRIAIDDFGTGYSSLSYLRQFPVDSLKIDRSFINGMGVDRESRAVVHTLIQLGKHLGIETLAEGIEDAGQLEQLRSEDCDSGQGYLFARPLTPEAVAELMAKEQVRLDAGP